MAKEAIVKIEIKTDNNLYIGVGETKTKINLLTHSFDFYKPFDFDNNNLLSESLISEIRQFVTDNTKTFWIFSQPTHFLVGVSTIRNREELDQLIILFDLIGANWVEIFILPETDIDFISSNLHGKIIAKKNYNLGQNKVEYFD